MKQEELYQNAVTLLQSLIRTPSLSKEEDVTAELLAGFLQGHGVAIHRKGNNVWAFNRHYDPAKPTILLNSHHDTVKPNTAYTRDPFSPRSKGTGCTGWAATTRERAACRCLRHSYTTTTAAT